MSLSNRLRQLLLGKPSNPLNLATQRHVALIAFFAWIGLGADGLSSACYGPEEAFIALGPHTFLAPYIAIATIVTVFAISLAYNQVIELFPSGGGGYKITTQLLGAHAGLVSGAALLVDYVLTITISVASGADALFSFLPKSGLPYKSMAEAGIIVLLIILNLRGMKESIQLLMPIFLGFVITHGLLIGYGLYAHENLLPVLFSNTIYHTQQLSEQAGWLFIAALAVRAYSLGSGTYTGIEAVSNNVHQLAEPRIRTGKWTMCYMAISLSITAGGILLLYLLWQVQPVAGKTLNAIVFQKILGYTPLAHVILVITLLLEAGLLLVGANTGFLAGPSVLANMAVDNWVPKRFRYLSSRLVTQNGIIVLGCAALLILWLSQGRVAWLVILYSINVFLTFSMAILGLCVYWWTHRNIARKWLRHFLFSALALLLASGILTVTLLTKFRAGGWVTVVITGLVVVLCLLTRRYYERVAQKLRNIDASFTDISPIHCHNTTLLQPNQPTAIIMVHRHRGVGMHTLLWILRMFPGHFKNFIFLTAGIIDVESFSAKIKLVSLQQETTHLLDYFVNYCQKHHLAANSMAAYGPDSTEQLTALTQQTLEKFPNSIVFASKLIFEHDSWLSYWLHNETTITLQRRLHALGVQSVILPMKID